MRVSASARPDETTSFPSLPLLAALGALDLRRLPRPAETGISPAREFAPRQLLVKFEGQRQARRSRCRGAPACAQAAAALRRSPAVVYAEPNYLATASAPPPNPRPMIRGPKKAPHRACRRGLGLETVELPLSQDPRQPLAAGLPRRHRRGRRLAQPDRRRPPGRRRASSSRSSTPASPTARKGRASGAAPTSGRPVRPGLRLRRPRPPSARRNGHGTHVAGTIAEKTDNGIGVTGLAYRAKLMPVRVLDRMAAAERDDIAKGIRFAVAHGADVINMSFNFGCGKRVPMVDEALREAYERGVVTVASAGNLGSEDCVSAPATGPRRDRRRRHHPGRLPRQLLAGRQGNRPRRPGGGDPGSRCPSVAARPIYQVTLRPDSTGTSAIPATTSAPRWPRPTSPASPRWSSPATHQSRS